MENCWLTHREQRTIMSLDEALDLLKHVDEYKYNFLTSDKVLGKETLFQLNNDLKYLGKGSRENCLIRGHFGLIGFDAYAVRSTKEGLEIAKVGLLSDHPLVADYIKEVEELNKRKRYAINERDFKTLKRLSDHYLRKTVKNYFKDNKPEIIKISSSEEIPGQDLIKFGFWDNEEELSEWTEKKRNLFDDAGDRKGFESRAYVHIKSPSWKLAVLNFNPYLYAHFQLKEPDFKQGVLYSAEGGNLATGLMRLLEPRDIGNGVVVMSKDRIPKYLQRTLGLREK